MEKAQRRKSENKIHPVYRSRESGRNRQIVSIEKSIFLLFSTLVE